MPRGCVLYTIDNTILGNTSKSTKKIFRPRAKGERRLVGCGRGTLHSRRAWRRTLYPFLPGLNQECPADGMSLESVCTSQ